MADINRIEWTEFWWKVINHRLADGPSNCWVNLPEAVRYIAGKLDVLPGEARHLLGSEAMPPTVPWVGLAFNKSLNHDNRIEPTAVVIPLPWLTDAEIEFSAGSIWSPIRGPIERVHVEGNHLEAWIGRRVAAAKEPAITKNKGGRPQKYDWDAFDREMMRRANTPDGLPSDRVELTRDMTEWCLNTWGEEPPESMIRDRVARRWPGE